MRMTSPGSCVRSQASDHEFKIALLPKRATIQA